jgi:hypothetical protein
MNTVPRDNRAKFLLGQFLERPTPVTSNSSHQWADHTVGRDVKDVGAS